jgi:hypothetical protein
MVDLLHSIYTLDTVHCRRPIHNDSEDNSPRIFKSLVVIEDKQE